MKEIIITALSMIVAICGYSQNNSDYLTKYYNVSSDMNSDLNGGGKLFNATNSAPVGGANYGPFLSYGAGEYSTQLNATHYKNADLWMRTNGQGGYGDWFKVWTSGNFSPSNYLPVTGGELTGSLTGTTADFSSSGFVASFGEVGNKIRFYSDLANQHPTITTSSGRGLRLEAGGVNVANFNNDGTTTLLGPLHGTYGSRFLTGSTTLTDHILTVRGGGSNGSFGFAVQANNGDNILKTDNLAYSTTLGGPLYGTVGTFTRNSSDPFNSVETQLALINSAGNGGAGTEIRFSTGSATSFIRSIVEGANSSAGSALVFGTTSSGTLGAERMRVTSAGNVLIGTTTDSGDPDAKLTVAGKIHSREVKVTVNAGADFVFDESYNLKPLSEVAEFISANKHLPEISTAEDMKKNGLDLGEMNVKLLQKIEELTLYLIEQSNQIKELQKQIKK